MTLRIGVLGAARITATALLRPATSTSDVEVVAIAARAPGRALAYADKHRIPRVHANYLRLLADPEVDAVYIPLPPSLHGKWTVAAVRAGKHVLVEKPFTANGHEAGAVAAAVQDSGLVVMEALHSLYPPLAGQLRDLIVGGTLGAIEHASAQFCAPIPPERTPSYTFQLRAFRDAVRDGEPLRSGLADSVAMMRTIDATYTRAGMSPRQPS
ncbi:Gfo/Idh/MocA family protein [Microbacterium sp. NPDC056044]|uniref:Gfo/Idh/MocA family protein n=1 Tax=Microbacterium sp. NPDC056044 TaxID=3345690 RepID=UPI0035E38BD1